MALGAMISGGVGLYNMWKGNKAAGNVVANQPTEGELRGSFSGTQGLIDRMTNFNQYAAPAMDLAAMEGNKGVQDAMMMGMGGSQANAIRNRLKKSGINQAYQNFTAGLGDAAQMQAGLDQNIFNQMNVQRQNKFNLGMNRANTQMGIGAGLLPEGGIGGLLNMGMAQMGINK